MTNPYFVKTVFWAIEQKAQFHSESQRTAKVTRRQLAESTMLNTKIVEEALEILQQDGSITFQRTYSPSGIRENRVLELQI